MLLLVLGCASVDSALARVQLELYQGVLEIEAEAEAGRCVDMSALGNSTVEGQTASGYREAIEGFVDGSDQGCWSRAFFEFEDVSSVPETETATVLLTGSSAEWSLALDNYPLSARALVVDQPLDSQTIEGSTITFTLSGPGVLSPGDIRITDDDQGESMDSAPVDDATWTDTTVVIEVPDVLEFTPYLVVFDQPWSHAAEATELDVSFPTRWNAPVL